MKKLLRCLPLTDEVMITDDEFGGAEQIIHEPHVHRSTNPVQLDFGGTVTLPTGQKIQTKIGSGRFCDGCGLLFWVANENNIPIIGG